MQPHDPLHWPLIGPDHKKQKYYFYKVIKNLYQNSESCVRVDNGTGRSEFFKCCGGVKQGEPLSPSLFNIYINDLSNILNSDELSDSPYLGDKACSHLLWADDLFLLSITASELQDKLDILAKFCKDWGLSVNIKKTKVIMFSRGGRLCKDRFFIDGLEILRTSSSINIWVW